MALTSTHDGQGNVILYGGTATHDNAGNVVLTVAASEEGAVIAEDEVSLSLVDISEYAKSTEVELTAEALTVKINGAEKTATDYLEFSDEGLCVADQTADTLGNNVLIDADSVNVRNGKTVLAKFAAKLIELGKNATDAVISLCNGKGKIQMMTTPDGIEALSLDSNNVGVSSANSAIIWSSSNENVNDDGYFENRWAEVRVDSNPEVIEMRHPCEVAIAAGTTVYEETPTEGANYHSEFVLTPVEMYAQANNITLSSAYNLALYSVLGNIEIQAMNLNLKSDTVIRTTMPIRQHFRCQRCGTALTLGTDLKKVPMGTVQNYSGGLLTVSNGGVKCEVDGVVEVSATVYATGMTALNTLAACYSKNNSKYEVSVAHTNGSRTYACCHLQTRTMLVNAGDVIYLYAQNLNAATGTVNADERTQLTIRYI